MPDSQGFVFSACVNVYRTIDKGSQKLYLCLRKLYANLKYSPHLSLVSSVIDGADVLFERMEQCLKKIRYEEIWYFVGYVLLRCSSDDVVAKSQEKLATTRWKHMLVCH